MLDLENLAGTPVLEPLIVLVLQVLIDSAVPLGSVDHEVIAVSHPANAVAAYFTWQGPARRLSHWGPDGADRALLGELADVDFIRRRYTRVIVGSGDHAFAPAIMALKAAGLDVVTVAPRNSTSAAVKLAAAESIQYIDTPAHKADRQALAA